MTAVEILALVIMALMAAGHLALEVRRHRAKLEILREQTRLHQEKAKIYERLLLEIRSQKVVALHGTVIPDSFARLMRKQMDHLVRTERSPS